MVSHMAVAADSFLLTWNNSYFYMFPTSSTTEFKIKKYLIIKILVPEVSHEPTTGKNIFRFCYTFHLKSQPIFWRKSHLKKNSEMTVSLINCQVHIYKKACTETTRHNKKFFFLEIRMFMFKAMFRTLRRPNETIPKSPI